jgi:hypothetical protein
MHSLLSMQCILSRSSGEEQSTFGQNSRANLNGTKKERKTHKRQLNGRKRNEERINQEGKKERKEGTKQKRKKERKKEKEL